MSLINDALKKAQQQRADAPARPIPAAAVTPPVSTPSVPVRTPSPVPPPTRPPSAISYLGKGPQAARPAPPTTTSYQAKSPVQPASTKTFWFCLGAIALVLISVGITVMFMRTPAEPAVATNNARPPSYQAAPPQAEVSFPAPTLSVTPLSLPTRAAAPTPEPTSTVSIPPAQPAPARAETIATATPPAPPPIPVALPTATASPAAAALPPIYAPRAPTPVNPAVRIQNFLDRLRVTGIRMSTTGSKVILGDHLFLVGEMVDSGLELRLVKIEQGVLTFADANGKTYIKLFQ